MTQIRSMATDTPVLTVKREQDMDRKAILIK